MVEGQHAGANEEWDIRVVFSGVRPGEKLFEELFGDGEEHDRTHHEKIFAVANGQDPHTQAQLAGIEAQVNQLIELANGDDEAGVRRLLAEIVPTYRP